MPRSPHALGGFAQTQTEPYSELSPNPEHLVPPQDPPAWIPKTEPPSHLSCPGDSQSYLGRSTLSLSQRCSHSYTPEFSLSKKDPCPGRQRPVLTYNSESGAFAKENFSVCTVMGVRRKMIWGEKKGQCLRLHSLLYVLDIVF